jgi:hypothetical protein
VKDIVVGSQSGQHVVNIRNDDANPVEFTVPLTINAEGTGAQVNISGSLSVTDLTIRGSGQSTHLLDSAEIDASGNVQIFDRLVVSGTNEISVGPNNNLSITGNVQEQDFGVADTGVDTLVLTAQGGDVQINGSVSVDALRMTGVDDAVITGDLIISEDSVLSVKSRYEVQGRVVLLNGATLTIHAAGGAPQVIFGGGLEISDDDGSVDRVVVNGARETIFTKVLSNTTNADNLLIADAQKLVVRDRGANAWIGAEDGVTQSIILGSSVGGLAASAQGATLSINANQVFLAASISVRAVELLPQTAGVAEAVTVGVSGVGVRTLGSGVGGLSIQATQFTSTDRVQLALDTGDLNIRTDSGLRSVDLGDSVTLANGADLVVNGASSLELDSIIKSGANAATLEQLKLVPAAAAGSVIRFDAFPVSGAPVLSFTNAGAVTLMQEPSAQQSTVRDLRISSDDSIVLAGQAKLQVAGGTLELAAAEAVRLDRGAALTGTAGTSLVFQGISDAQSIAVGDKFAGDSNTMRVTAAGDFTAIDGFDRIVVGGVSQTGGIAVGDDKGVSFNDTVELHFSSLAPNRTPTLTGKISGTSFKTVDVSTLDLTDATFSMTGLLSMPLAGRITGNTVLEAGSIDLQPSSEPVIFAAPGQTLTLRPIEKNSRIELGATQAADLGNGFVLNVAELASLRDGFGRIVIGHDQSGGTLGTVAITGPASFKDALSVYGENIDMTATASLMAPALELRARSGMDLSQVVSDGAAYLQSVDGTIRADASAAASRNVVARELVMNGLGPVAGSSDRVLRVQSDKVSVRPASGYAYQAARSDGSITYYAFSGGLIYQELVVVAGRGDMSPSLKDAGASGWREGATQTPTALASTTMASLASGSGALSTSTTAFAPANEATLAYLDAAPVADWVTLSRSALAARGASVDVFSDVFDPLTADAAGDADLALLENAWLLGSPSYQPDSSGAVVGGGGSWNFITERELEL